MEGREDWLGPSKRASLELPRIPLVREVSIKVGTIVSKMSLGAVSHSIPKGKNVVPS